MSRILYDRNEWVKILSVDSRQAMFGIRVGQVFQVCADYENIIYLYTPVKGETADDWFYPDQVERVPPPEPPKPHDALPENHVVTVKSEPLKTIKKIFPWLA